jgi:transposase
MLPARIAAFSSPTKTRGEGQRYKGVGNGTEDQGVERNVMDGIFYVLRTGCQWKAMPPEFGSGSAIHSYFQLLVKKKVFTKLWKLALQEYDDLIGIDWEWQSMDGAMSKAPLGGEKNRAQSHGPGQAGHEAVCIDRRGGHPLVRSRRRCQHA